MYRTGLKGRVLPLSRLLILILLVAALCGGLLVGYAGCGTENTTVETAQGQVKGAVDDNGLYVFKGIPYAKPPEGDLRFKAPQPPEPWDDTFEALDFGPIAMQPTDEYEATELPQSEDCLTLNIWTPGIDDAGRPVMVWIHGGGWTNGSGRDPWYDGAAFAQRGDVVLVTINYRLGAFGWLYLGDIGSSGYAESGNLGLLDQAAALEWVRDNIAGFGGDPHKVTVFGESAGSMSVGCLLGMPAAKGLFQQAIEESGALNTLRNPAYAEGITQKLMAKAGVGDVEGLLSLTSEELLQAEEDLMGDEFLTDTLFGPVVDGTVLPEPPLHAIANGSAAGIPLLIGTNLDEVRLWSLYIPGLLEFSIKADLQAMPWLKGAITGTLEDIVASYESRRPEASEGDIAMAIGTDILFRVPAIRLAEAQAKNQPRTWMYLFTWPSTVDELGSCHAVELPFVFNNLGAEGVADILGGDPPQELADMMQDTWIAFARNGDPNNVMLPDWPSYEVGARATMQLDVQPLLVNDPYGADRQVWDGVPFDSVVPSL
ncbi:MAG: carboxylesterase/lipase family protein [Actinobacteria bacterium]|jgi:para-nitrobenzyl esterase|nr:MAG: carboxylesterase/lipase family protein [Actinomycetota bacterium]